MKKIFWPSVILVILIIVSVYSTKIYYPPLPIDSISKREVLSALNRSSETIVKFIEEDKYEWYIARMKDGNPYQNLKDIMSKEGWSYKEQLGAVIIFVKDGQEIGVGSQMWTRKYVILKFPKDWKSSVQ